MTLTIALAVITVVLFVMAIYMLAYALMDSDYYKRRKDKNDKYNPHN